MSSKRIKESRTERKHRSKTFSGLPSEVTDTLHLEVPQANDEGESSQDDLSSPETAPEQKQDAQKVQKIQNKKKKKRQPKIIKGEPPLSDGDVEVPKTSTQINSSRIEKTPSFRKRAKPEHLEKIAREYMEKDGRKSIRTDSSRADSRNDGSIVECNIVLLGDLGVGKTALAVRFVTRRYLHEYDSTLERTYDKQIKCSGEPVFVRLYDTVNKGWEHYADYADGYIVMYSVTSHPSQVNAMNIVNSIRNSKNPIIRHIPILLAGNKTELEHARKVTKEEPAKFSVEHGCSHREISVACTINVDSIVKTVVKQVISKDGGRMTPCLSSNEMLDPNGPKRSITAPTTLSRMPSNAKSKMINFLKKKEKS